MCVALGLGIIAAMDLGVSYAEGRFPVMHAQWGIVNGVVFTGIMAFWALRVVHQGNHPGKAASSPTRLIIQRWNDALISYRQGDLALSSVGVNSFLPGVEQTVDRVMARKMVQ